MHTKHWNLLVAFATLVPVVLFSFSWFCLSRMAEMSNQLTNCKNHILEFKENMLHFKNRRKDNLEELMKALNELQYEIMKRRNQSGNLDEKKMDTLSEGETVSNIFEAFKFFLPHLRKVKRIYPKVIIGQGKTNVSFALGIPTVSRGNHTYLKQTLTSIVTRIMPWEEKDSVVIVSVAESNEDYVKSVADMVTKRFKRQVKSGSLEVISVPDFFYPNVSDEEPTDESQRKKRWQFKQALDFCVLMAYAQPKATYYLQLEDDIIAKEMYFTKLTKFVSNVTSNDWLCIQFSVLGFIGKLFKSKDLPGFVHFVLMFYKERPIDLLLYEFFHLKICDIACMHYKPSLFQHVGIHSSLPERKQHLKQNIIVGECGGGAAHIMTEYLDDQCKAILEKVSDVGRRDVPSIFLPLLLPAARCRERRSRSLSGVPGLRCLRKGDLENPDTYLGMLPNKCRKKMELEKPYSGKNDRWILKPGYRKTINFDEEWDSLTKSHGLFTQIIYNYK
ncbi:alpha-1,3-mannosyl-glycoprotein 4-beta-N-acetylglucosaminyltransferase-like protein MGAT4D [Erethizon dorsatum]